MPKKSPSDSDKLNISFEEAMLELESIIEHMDSGQLPLEESLGAYTRGASLLQHCRSKLSKIEQKISMINESGNVQALEVNDD